MRSEFEFIRYIKKKYSLDRVGDDCAVLPKDSKTDLLVTADLLVEDIDFRLDWTTPELLGHKVLAVSLSDIAAMGGTPKWAMLSVAASKKLWRGKFLDRFYDGWHRLAAEHGVELVGGDISQSPESLAIDSIVFGDVAKGSAVLRSGARPGDSIFVTGALGGAAGGLKLLESDARRSQTKARRLIDRQRQPVPRVAAGKYLGRKKLATSMIDISDGLAADLRHLCDASDVGALIDLRMLPTDPALDLFGEEKVQLALGGGEDFELLFTSPRKKISHADLPSMTRIGEITPNSGIVELVTDHGITPMPRFGYRHF